MRIGIVGWGLRKSLISKSVLLQNDHEICALADPSPKAQMDFQKTFGEKTTTHSFHEQLLHEKLDAVFVLSPDHLHEEHANFFLNNGIPVYLEKPMGISIKQCDSILETAFKTKTKLFVGHNMRYFGVVQKMKGLIESGAIGEVKTAWCRHFISYGGEAYFCDWHADRSKSYGLLLQKGAHDIDVLHYLCKGYTNSVSAMGSLMLYGNLEKSKHPVEQIEFKNTWPPESLTNLNPIVDVEDVSLATMQLDNGVLASYEQCHFAPDAWRNYTIIGTRGRIENYGDAPGKSKVILWNKSRYSYDPDGDEQFEIPEAAGGHGGSDELILKDFVNFVKNDSKTQINPVAARMAVAAGVCATDSLRDHSKKVEIPKLSSDLVTYFENGQKI